MKHDELLTETFTGFIISDYVPNDGKRIGFISPYDKEVRKEIINWKERVGTKRILDGNIQFIMEENDPKFCKKHRNEKGLEINMPVKFSIRYDGSRLPQAYLVSRLRAEDVRKAEEPKPLEIDLEEVKAFDLVNDATKAGVSAYAEADADEDDVPFEDEFDDVDFSEYDDYDDYEDKRRPLKMTKGE